MESARSVVERLAKIREEVPDGFPLGGTNEKVLSRAEVIIEADREAIRKECADRAIGYCESNRLVKGWQVELRAAIEGKK